jgi:hypothetical protein
MTRLFYKNAADAATFAGGSFHASYPVTRLAGFDVSEAARTTSAAKASTWCRFKLSALATLLFVAFPVHNLSSTALARLRLGTASFDQQMVDAGAMDERITWSGAANGTRVNSAGVIVAGTAPRHNYNSATLSYRGVLFEPARTNLGLRSAEFDNASWTKSNSTAVSNQTVAPDGTGAGDEIAATAANAIHLVSQAVATVASTTYATSFFVKLRGGNATHIQVFADNNGGGNGGYMNVRLSDGVITRAAGAQGAGTNIMGGVDPHANGWYRVWITVQHASATTRFGVVLLNTANANATFLPSIAMVTTDTIAIWGGQLEAGDNPTSYIPTTTASVARTIDAAAITAGNFTAIHNATEYTLYVEGDAAFDSSAAIVQALVGLSDNTSNNRTMLRTQAASDTADVTVISGGVSQAGFSPAGTITYGTAFKLAGAFKVNDVAGCLNGGVVSTDGAATLSVSPNRIDLGAAPGASALNGHIKRFTYWPSRLTNVQLQSLTTSGPSAIDFDSGWVSALQMSFIGSTPAAWGDTFDLQFLLPDAGVSTLYGILEVDDAANVDTWWRCGRAFLATQKFAPAAGPEYPLDHLVIDHTDTVKAPGGKNWQDERAKQRGVGISYPVLTLAEGKQLHQMQLVEGLTDEVYYLPDAADTAENQEYGFLGQMSRLDPLRSTRYTNMANAIQLEQKMPS